MSSENASSGSMSIARSSRLPGVRRAAAEAIVTAQPRTVLELLRLHDVGRRTARVLLDAGLISDPEGVQTRSRFDFDPLP